MLLLLLENGFCTHSLLCCNKILKYNIPIASPHAIYIGIVNLEHITTTKPTIFVKIKKLRWTCT